MVRPLKSIPEKEIKEELELRKKEKREAYKEWLERTRPKRARFVKHFTFFRPFPILLLLGPILLAWGMGTLFPSLAKEMDIMGMLISLFVLILCFVGSSIEAFCEGAFQEMCLDEQYFQSKKE